MFRPAQRPTRGVGRSEAYTECSVRPTSRLTSTPLPFSVLPTFVPPKNHPPPIGIHKRFALDIDEYFADRPRCARRNIICWLEDKQDDFIDLFGRRSGVGRGRSAWGGDPGGLTFQKKGGGIVGSRVLDFCPRPVSKHNLSYVNHPRGIVMRPLLQRVICIV